MIKHTLSTEKKSRLGQKKSVIEDRDDREESEESDSCDDINDENDHEQEEIHNPIISNILHSDQDYRYNGISLFSGMGGDTLGMESAGINIIAFSEYIPAFQRTHLLNFPNSKLLGESVKSNILNIPDEEFKQYENIDFLFAGFPCQSFSTGGKRKMNDPRNTMFREFVRVAKLTNAKVIIGENVKGLLTKKTENNELYIDIIKQEFENLDYSVIIKVFACHKYGIPQKRERLVILGIKNEYIQNGTFKLEFPDEITPTQSQQIGLRDIIEFDMDGCLNMSDDVFNFNSIPNNCILTDMDNEEIENNVHPYLRIKKETLDKSYNEKTYDTLFSFSKRASPIHCEIIDIRKPCKTLICTYEHQPRLFVPHRNKNGNFIRMLNVNELKQIQGFPKNYQLYGTTKQQIIQIGNAVPPPLIKQIVEKIIN